jgi:hypothetical protein
MKNIALFQQLQRQQQLLRVRTNRLHVQSHIVAVLFKQFAQVHAARVANVSEFPSILLPEHLEHQTQMILVIEMTVQQQNVISILAIGVVQPSERVQLAQTRLFPV